MELQNVVLEIFRLGDGKMEPQFVEEIQQFTKSMLDCKGKEMFTENFNKMIEAS